MNNFKDELEYLNGILDRTHELVARYDQKISINLALLGVFLSLFLNNDNLDTYKNIVKCLDSYLRGYELLYLLFFFVLAHIMCFCTYLFSTCFDRTDKKRHG